MQFKGVPQPKVRWTHTKLHPKALEATTAEKDSKHSKEVSSKIAVDSVCDAHYGKYTCEISNAAGRTTSSCFVEVASSQRVFQSYERAKKSVFF